MIRQAIRMTLRDWRAGELRFLLVALIVAVSALSAVAFFVDRVAVYFRAVVVGFCYPDAAAFIHVDVGRVPQHGFGGHGAYVEAGRCFQAFQGIFGEMSLFVC